MRRLRMRLGALLAVAALFAAGLGLSASAQGPERVDLAIVLALDCSYSVDSREYDLQRKGLAKAFLDEAVV